MLPCGRQLPEAAIIPRKVRVPGRLRLASGVLMVTLGLLTSSAATSSAEAQSGRSPNLPTGIREGSAAARDMLFGGGSVAMRYGNWVGPGWWGGSESSTRPGALAPVDDLDAVAQKHDFGYQLAEELGRGRPGVEGAYKLMADMIAIRDAKALDPDPSRWSHPPRDAALAKSFVNRLIISFEEWQTRYNRYKSRDMTPDDITDLDTINRALDDQPDMAKFEAMQKQRVRQWDQQHATWQTQKQPTPTKTPKPGPDCTKGSFMERTLCLHKADPNAKPPKQ